MNHASLFSGIGGFDLAAEWMGWTNIFNCEIDAFCQKVLAYHFPNAKQYKDITTTDFHEHANTIDILTGGFPCQPFSKSGQRKGISDKRYLWGEMFRAIQQIKPTWIIVENVYGIISIEQGMVFKSINTELESENYEVQSFVIPAASVNAPHKRDRVWIVANSKSIRRRKLQNTQCKTGAQKSNELSSVKYTISTWDGFPNESPLCCGNDGFPEKLDGITFPRWRRQSIKAYGNAIVPQIALQIFRTIEEVNQYEHCTID